MDKIMGSRPLKSWKEKVSHKLQNYGILYDDEYYSSVKSEEDQLK